MVGIMLGTTAPKDVYVGGSKVSAVYAGTTKVRPTAFDKKLEDAVLASSGTPASATSRAGVCVRGNYIYMGRYAYNNSKIYSMNKSTYTSSVSYTGGTPAWGVAVSDDGSHILMSDYDGHKLYSASMSGGNVSSLSVTTKNVGSYYFREMCCKPDGTKLYVTSHYNDYIYEYTMSTPRDVSTASLTYSWHTNSSYTLSLVGISPDGKNIFFNINNTLYQRELGTPYNLSTVANTNISSMAILNESWGLDIFPDGSGFCINEPSGQLRWYTW